MRHILFSIFTLAMITGCSTKAEKSFFNTFEKNKDYHKQLNKTERITLKEGNVTKVLLTANYLFSETSKLEDKRDEKFIVALYTDDDSTFPSGDFNLTLNGNEPKSVEKITKNDKRLKNISFLSEWSELYLFTFPHISSTRFKLILQSKEYGQGEMNFAKLAKFTFSKEPF